MSDREAELARLVTILGAACRRVSAGTEVGDPVRNATELYDIFLALGKLPEGCAALAEHELGIVP